MLFRSEEDFDDASTRALYTALIEYAAQNDFFERENFSARLDESLRALCDQFWARAQTLPDLSEPDRARELERTAYRLRLNHDKQELAQIEVMLRDQDQPPDVDDEQPLRARVEILLKRIMDGQKALGARTMLKPHAIQMARVG